MEKYIEKEWDMPPESERECKNCGNLRSYYENGSPLGSGEFWPMEVQDCADEDASFEWEGPESGPCPAFKPPVGLACAKCGKWVADDFPWCEDCYPDEKPDWW